MSEFKVTLEEIATIEPHPNADRLEIANLAGRHLQIIVGKDQFQPGDRAIYFPVDSLIPEHVQEKIGVTGKLSGKNKDRVKTVRLRGEVSQGLVVPTGTLFELPLVFSDQRQQYIEGTVIPVKRDIDFAPQLGVIKYEPPVKPEGDDAKRKPLPDYLPHYDIESAQRFPNVFGEDEYVYVDEKLEGSHMEITYHIDGGVVSPAEVSSRNNIVSRAYERDENNEEIFDKPKPNKFLDTALDIDMALFPIVADIIAIADPEPSVVSFVGELIGPDIQKNIYGLKEHQFVPYDIRVDGRYLKRKTVDALGINTPQVFAGKLSDFLAGRNIVQAANGESVYGAKLREGIVIRPEQEEYVRASGFSGRKILKVRDPVYLAETGL